MKVKDYVRLLKTYDQDKEVIFYNSVDYDLTEVELESIIDVDGRLEITFE